MMRVLVCCMLQLAIDCLRPFSSVATHRSFFCFIHFIASAVIFICPEVQTSLYSSTVDYMWSTRGRIWGGGY